MVVECQSGQSVGSRCETSIQTLCIEVNIIARLILLNKYLIGTIKQVDR